MTCPLLCCRDYGSVESAKCQWSAVKHASLSRVSNALVANASKKTPEDGVCIVSGTCRHQCFRTSTLTVTLTQSLRMENRKRGSVGFS